MREGDQPPAEGHVHGPRCACGEEVSVMKCLECGLHFEAGIADSSGRTERCPQCGLQNSERLEGAPPPGTYVIRHSSRFR